MRTVAMLGFQSTGKTTYLGAFFAACDAGVDDMAITTYGEGNREYLNALADQLAQCKRLERTSQAQPGELRLSVRLGVGASDQQLLIPDLSGELLRDSMSHRLLDASLENLMTGTDAFLIFVRADRIMRAERLADFNAALLAAGESIAGEVAPERPEDWTVEQASTQARLTDVAQELVRLRHNDRLRIGIVISAWDKRMDAQTPLEWASKELGLLLQMVKNAEVDWEIFGVSAQGGDFGNPTDLKRLQETTLVERPIVRLAGGESAGIEAPLKWALQD